MDTVINSFVEKSKEILQDNLVIAKQLARMQNVPHMSAQAVGGAVGHNGISIIIPCHRVVGTNGSLTGYAGGIVSAGVDGIRCAEAVLLDEGEGW